jgi:excisionase family DNA binding protein
MTLKSILDKTGKHPMDREIQCATMTVEEAHRLLGKDKISRGGFYAAINRGEVPHVRMGCRILIPTVAFFRWLECAVQSTNDR